MHFLQSLREDNPIFETNIVYVSRCLTYQRFWTESSIGGICSACFFTFEQKLYKLSNFLFCSISFSPTHARTKYFYVVFFVQSFNFILFKFQIDLHLILSFFETCCLFGSISCTKRCLLFMRWAYVVEVKRSTASVQYFGSTAYLEKNQISTI